MAPIPFQGQQKQQQANGQSFQNQSFQAYQAYYQQMQVQLPPRVS